MIQEIATRINEALAHEEVRVEARANHARMILLYATTVIALFNVRAVSIPANLFNFGALAVAYLYGAGIFLVLKTRGYRPAVKYVTSFTDITLVHLILLLYTRLDIPSVALKNPVFYLVYPLLALTLFRYNPRLTALTGAYTLGLYASLFLYVATRAPIERGAYTTELFEARATIVGQLTKILILAAYVSIAWYLARYSRSLFHKLISDEIRMRAEKEAIERELELASQVQAQLLPREYPEVKGLSLHGAVLEGRFVGGDYYDFIKLSDHSLLLLMGDVSGKGVPAALIMSGVRASARLSVSLGLGLEDLVFRLNEMLLESTAETSYLTLFAAEIDTLEGVIRYINCGHPPPLLHRDDGLSSLSYGTAPVGLFPSLPGLKLHSEPFRPGSLLVACTDGVSERANPEGEFFGGGLLREFVARNHHLDCAAFVGLLLKEVRQFGADSPLEDDAALAVAAFR